MQIVESIDELRSARKVLAGQVGLVPTMGYLHAGHLALVKAAREDNDSVIATIFVNPSQFTAGEDLETYPRDLPRDIEILKNAGVDLVFTPSPQVIYPPRFQTYVEVEEVTQGREGSVRREHFRGVATVVAKLFNITQPNVAYFGQKDAQQVVVIRQMIRDLNFPLKTQICPIVRESDGLALSSRNVYLDPQERIAAVALHRALLAASELYEAGERDPDEIREAAYSILNKEALVRGDYVSLADANTLEELIEPSDKPLLLSLAAAVGKTRLLDNCLLPMSLNTREGASASLGLN